MEASNQFPVYPYKICGEYSAFTFNEGITHNPHTYRYITAEIRQNVRGRIEGVMPLLKWKAENGVLIPSAETEEFDAVVYKDPRTIYLGQNFSREVEGDHYSGDYTEQIEYIWTNTTNGEVAEKWDYKQFKLGRSEPKLPPHVLVAPDMRTAEMIFLSEYYVQQHKAWFDQLPSESK